MSIEMKAAERERFALLAEELGEAIQIVGKILRHGLYSRNPLDGSGPLNVDMLEREIGDVLAAVYILSAHGSINQLDIDKARAAKLSKVGQFLHEKPNVEAAKLAPFRAEAIECAVRAEVVEACKKFPLFGSAHEGFAVLLEEVEELKAEVFKKSADRSPARLEEEAVQVAAVAIKFVLSCVMRQRENDARYGNAK